MILNHDMKRCDIEVNLTLYAVYHFIDSNNLEREGPAKKGASKKKKKKERRRLTHLCTLTLWFQEKFM